MYLKLAEPIYSIEINEEERAQAGLARKHFKDMLDKMDRAFSHLEILNNALNGFNDSTQFEQLRKLFKKYKRKTQEVFNEFIEQLESALKEAYRAISDTEMNRIIDTIVAEVREIRDGVIQLLHLLDEPESPEFIATFTDTVERLMKRKESLDEVVSDQLFSHIDFDILGKIRLGKRMIPLTKNGAI